jgi:hypothetical protein
MGISVLLIKAFEVFEINEPASAGFLSTSHGKKKSAGCTRS